MFDLTTIILIVLLCFIAATFWHIRQLGELAQQHAQRYCSQQQLQFLDIARQQLRLSLGRKELKSLGIYWRTEYSFGFSSDREHRYEGVLVMANRRLLHIETPVYRTTHDTQHEQPFNQAPQASVSKSYTAPDYYQ